jgi:hypothetical protein
MSDYYDGYHLDPTVQQLELIGSLLDELPAEEIEKLWKTPDGWHSSLDFWITNYGRAEDLIRDLERVLNKEGTT